MTCVSIPNGVICFGGEIVRIDVNGRYVTFENHRVFGPIRCRADGEVTDKQFSEKSPFCPVWERWVDQGKRVDEHGRAIVDQMTPLQDFTFATSLAVRRMHNAMTVAPDHIQGNPETMSWQPTWDAAIEAAPKTPEAAR